MERDMIFVPWKERIDGQYDIERVVLDFHITIQKSPDFFKPCIGLFVTKTHDVTFRPCMFRPVLALGQNCGRWSTCRGSDSTEPICWAYMEYPDMLFEVLEGE